ncbi:hypothetical protein R1flu_008945 [Riccia fluitans]|uniref:DDE-1 domain-containing protein n=1 Tax=Riccia fluitans TaxID=41844 RepID=A0ABD1Z1H4_9MARC
MAIDLLDAGYSGREIASVRHSGHIEEVWQDRKELEIEFINLLNELMDASVGFNSVIIQFQLRAFLQVRCKEILREEGGSFEINRSFVKKWIKDRLGWSYRKATTPASHLPTTWKEMGSLMISRLAYLVFAYGIPMELVINSDETGVQLLPAGNLHSFRLKGYREVLIQGEGYKRMIIVMVSSNAKGEMLPGQVIFEGSTSRSRPHCSEARALTSQGWNLTQSVSHWTTLEKLQEFVEKLLVPWIASTCKRLGLDPKKQKSVWIIDCYKVHLRKEFREWMKDHYPLIIILLVPANTTSKLQPADVVLMSFKCAIQRNFAQWAMGEKQASWSRASKQITHGWRIG